MAAAAPEAAALSAARRAWPALVGERLAELTRVEGISDGVLEVKCMHPAVRLDLGARQDLAAALAVPGVSEVRLS